LTIAGASRISQAGLDGGEDWLTLIIFVVLASVTVLAPVVYYLLAGASAERLLNPMKAWLVANNATVMVVLFVVLGAKLVGDGLGGLTA
jgi:DMSO/TMAO reductase YedYZ heme-binding membrane subunit